MEAARTQTGSADWIVLTKTQPKPDVNQPKSIDDRTVNAHVLANMIDYPVDIYLDLLDNDANLAFGALPERLVIVKDNKVEFIGGDGPFNYSIDAIADHLKKML